MTQCDIHPEPEEWRALPGASGYEVSIRGGWRKADGTSLAVRDSNRGYPQVDYTRDDGRRVKGRPLHQVMLETFKGQRPEGEESRHLDDNPHHPCIENLCWGPPPANMDDRKRNNPAAPPKPKAICTMCGRNPVTRGSKWRCKDCVAWLGQQAADDIGRKGMSIIESAARLNYPSVEGLQRLAERYGGYGVPALPGDAVAARLGDAASRNSGDGRSRLGRWLAGALRRGDAA